MAVLIKGTKEFVSLINQHPPPPAFSDMVSTQLLRRGEGYTGRQKLPAERTFSCLLWLSRKTSWVEEQGVVQVYMCFVTET